MSSYAQQKERETGIAENQNNYRHNNVRDLSNNFQDLGMDDNKSQNTILTDNLNEGGGEENQNADQSRNGFHGTKSNFGRSFDNRQTNERRNVSRSPLRSNSPPRIRETVRDRSPLAPLRSS